MPVALVDTSPVFKTTLICADARLYWGHVADPAKTPRGHDVFLDCNAHTPLSADSMGLYVYPPTGGLSEVWPRPCPTGVAFAKYTGVVYDAM